MLLSQAPHVKKNVAESLLNKSVIGSVKNETFCFVFLHTDTGFLLFNTGKFDMYDYLFYLMFYDLHLVQDLTSELTIACKCAFKAFPVNMV